MLSKDNIKNLSNDFIEILKRKSDIEISDAIKVEDKDGGSVLINFARFRSEAEFICFVNRLSPFFLETILPKIYSVLVRGADSSLDRKMQGSVLHMILNHQTDLALHSLFQRVDTYVIYRTLTAENQIPEDQRLLWRILISKNEKLKRTHKSQVSHGDILIQSLEQFIALVENFKTLTTSEPKKVELKAARLVVELVMGYRDVDAETLGWNMLHFLYRGLQNEKADKKCLEETLNKLIRNLKPELLARIADQKCRDKKFNNCNLLHFVLLPVPNFNDVTLFISKADNSTLNKWLCERMDYSLCYGGVGMRNWTPLQMMLFYCDLPLLQSVVERCDPKTLFIALRPDINKRLDSDNVLFFTQIVQKNSIIKNFLEQSKLVNKISAIYYFYELYHYFITLNDKKHLDLGSRKAQVLKLMKFFDNPPEDYVLCPRLEAYAIGITPFKNVLQYYFVRPFKDILLDLCTEKSAEALKHGYQLCKSLYLEHFAAAPSSPKRVRIDSQPEVFEFKM